MDPDLKDALDACIPIPASPDSDDVPELVPASPEDDSIGWVPDVTDNDLRENYLLMSTRMAVEGTLEALTDTYRKSFSFGPRYRASLKDEFNPIDPFLVFPTTTLSEEGLVPPVNRLDMIDTRTNMSVRETLRMLKVYLRHIIQGPFDSRSI